MFCQELEQELQVLKERSIGRSSSMSNLEATQEITR